MKMLVLVWVLCVNPGTVLTQAEKSILVSTFNDASEWSKLTNTLHGSQKWHGNTEPLNQQPIFQYCSINSHHLTKLTLYMSVAKP